MCNILVIWLFLCTWQILDYSYVLFILQLVYTKPELMNISVNYMCNLRIQGNGYWKLASFIGKLLDIMDRSTKKLVKYNKTTCEFFIAGRKTMQKRV